MGFGKEHYEANETVYYRKDSNAPCQKTVRKVKEKRRNFIKIER
jgi:hypothetical protein